MIRYAIIIFAIVILTWLPEQSHGMDPVTLAILTPIAIKGAQKASPYALRGMYCGAEQIVDAGKDVLKIGLLPLGVLQTTVGLPFGEFDYGVKNIGRGMIAPLSLCVNVATLPLAFCGVRLNE